MSTLFLRRVLPFFAVISAAYPATIIESGFLTPTPVTTGFETIPIFVNSFDTHLGTLDSATITILLEAQFQADVLALPNNPIAPQAEVVGYSATLLPSFLAVQGIPISGTFALQSPLAIAVALPYSVTPITTLTAPTIVTGSVLPFLLSSFELPVADVPIAAVDLETPGVVFTALAPSTILSSFNTLESDYVSITYTYTPLLGSTGPGAVPEPIPAALVATGLLVAVTLGLRKVRRKPCSALRAVNPQSSSNP